MAPRFEHEFIAEATKSTEIHSYAFGYLASAVDVWAKGLKSDEHLAQDYHHLMVSVAKGLEDLMTGVWEEASAEIRGLYPDGKPPIGSHIEQFLKKQAGDDDDPPARVAVTLS